MLSDAGFRHGFSLRMGGVSRSPFTSLNLGRGLGDEPAAVDENHSRFAHEVGFQAGSLYEISQVHGRRVRTVAAGEDPRRVRQEEGDALTVDLAGRAVGVRTADCVPVLIADPDSGAVAAVHSGWRGTVEGVLGAAIEVMIRRYAAAPERLLVAIGPHIRQDAFEVGDDVAVKIQAVAHNMPVIRSGNPRPFVDLTKVICSQLQWFGVADAHVQDVGGCSFAEPELYFSYRRDGAKSGRHLAAIVAR